MPTYEYRCCEGHLFEQARRITDDSPPPDCPRCGATSQRLASGGTGFLLRGHGWSGDSYTLAHEKGLDCVGSMDDPNWKDVGVKDATPQPDWGMDD